MILTKQDLREWIKEEREQYLGEASYFKYWLRLMGGFEESILWN